MWEWKRKVNLFFSYADWSIPVRAAIGVRKNKMSKFRSDGSVWKTSKPVTVKKRGGPIKSRRLELNWLKGTSWMRDFIANHCQPAGPGIIPSERYIRIGRAHWWMMLELSAPSFWNFLGSFSERQSHGLLTSQWIWRVKIDWYLGFYPGT